MTVEQANTFELIHSLMDDLSSDRIEIDMMKLAGPTFGNIDDRLVGLQLVEQGFTDAAMFTADGEVVQPEEVLHEKAVLIERGTPRTTRCNATSLSL